MSTAFSFFDFYMMKRMKNDLPAATLLLALAASSPLHADWSWPWENGGDYQDSDDGFGDFLGGFFGGERTHLDLEFELDMQMRYDMQHDYGSQQHYYGYNAVDGYNGQVPYYSQSPVANRNVPVAPSTPAQTYEPEYRDAIEAQRIMVEKMASRQKQTVQRFEESKEKVARKMQESADPESILLDMQERRNAAFREMQQQFNGYKTDSAPINPNPADATATTGMVKDN